MGLVKMLRSFSCKSVGLIYIVNNCMPLYYVYLTLLYVYFTSECSILILVSSTSCSDAYTKHTSIPVPKFVRAG